MKSIKTDIINASKLLKQHDNIALIAHTRPDGDTLGASIALYLALIKLGKNVAVYCDSAIDDAFLQFPYMDSISANISGQVDLLVSVDCGDLARTGELSNYYYKHSNTMTVDHHGGEYFSRYNCVYPYASTCQIVLEIIEAMGVNLDKDIATSLYMGLCTDTGNFMNANTDKDSFIMASKLIEYGVQVDYISRVFFKNIGYLKSKLVGTAMSRMRLYCDNKVSLLYVDKPDLDKLELDAASCEGLVQYAFNVECASVAVSIAYHANNAYKVSMRSKGLDIRQVCQHFGGGGHLVASGCMVSGYLEDVIEKIVKALDDYLW